MIYDLKETKVQEQYLGCGMAILAVDSESNPIALEYIHSTRDVKKTKRKLTKLPGSHEIIVGEASCYEFISFPNQGKYN